MIVKYSDNLPQAEVNKKIIIISLIVILMCSLYVINPFAIFAAPLNHILLSIIPLPLGIAMIFIAPAIYFGMTINNNYKMRDFSINQQRAIKSKIEGISFFSHYREYSPGTKWEVTNTNEHAWINAVFLIERVCEGKKNTEKHFLGDVQKSQKMTIDSILNVAPYVKWRVMVVSKDECQIRVPEIQASEA